MPTEHDTKAAIAALDAARVALVAARAHLGDGDGDPVELPDEALQAVLRRDADYLETKAQVKAALGTLWETVSPDTWNLILELEQAQNLRSARTVELAWRLGQRSR